MLKQPIGLYCAAVAAAAGCALAHGQTVTIPLSSGVSFQNEGTLTFDDTARLIAQDGLWGPTVTGTVTQNAYATGTSPTWFDAASLSFDLAGAGVNYLDITSASLEMYIRNGNSGGWTTHSYLLLPGAFNPTAQEAGPLGTPFNLPNGGLVSEPIAPGDFTSNTFSITVRMWEVNVDMVRLVVNVVPTPGAAAMLGLAGVASLRRRRR